MKSRSQKKLKLEDITYYSTKRQHPFSYTRTPTKNTTAAPTQNIQQLAKNIFNSPINCCEKSRGIMKKAIAARIEQYKKDCKRKYLRKTIDQIRQQSKQKQTRQLRQSPLINKESKKLYQKVAEKRNLSPQVLVRFEQYQHDRTTRKLKLRLEEYMKERKKIPRPQQIISPQKLSQMEQAKKLIDNFSEHLQKFVIKTQPVEVIEEKN